MTAAAAGRRVILSIVSKAFTKEDEGAGAAEIQRRRAPLPAGTPNYVTPRGLRALRDELEALAPSPAGPEHAAAVARRAELEARVATAVLAAPPADAREIRFGARVKVRADDNAERELQIVGVDEAAPTTGLIAFVAPLARALLGHRVHDVVSVRTPGGEETLEILSVAYEPR
ncbi:MAG TPA: GreA/GreB family elongation factor [Polyangia bacterium]|nr:GreA/GreB family elongation factor [Polyangia bacterium]